MINPTQVLAHYLADRLEEYYRLLFDAEDELLLSKACVGARFAIEQIGNSDALYHNVYHTVMVTMVGQEIFRGRFLRKRLTPSDWLHYTWALL